MGSAMESETYVEIDNTNNTGFLIFKMNYPCENLNESIRSLHGGGSLQETRLLERKHITLSRGIERLSCNTHNNKNKLSENYDLT